MPQLQIIDINRHSRMIGDLIRLTASTLRIIRVQQEIGIEAIFPQCPNLEELSSMTSVTAVPKDLSKLPKMQRLTSLQRLVCTPERLASIVPLCPALTSLHMSTYRSWYEQHPLSLDALAPLATSLINLRVACTAVTLDTTIFPNLTTLSLDVNTVLGSSKLSESFFRAFPAVSSLRLVVDGEQSLAAMSVMPSLTALDVFHQKLIIPKECKFRCLETLRTNASIVCPEPLAPGSFPLTNISLFRLVGQNKDAALVHIRNFLLGATSTQIMATDLDADSLIKLLQPANDGSMLLPKLEELRVDDWAYSTLRLELKRPGLKIALYIFH